MSSVVAPAPEVTIGGRKFPAGSLVRVYVCTSRQASPLLATVAAAMVAGGGALLWPEDGAELPVLQGNVIRVRVKASGQVLELLPDIAARVIAGGTAELVPNPQPQPAAPETGAFAGAPANAMLPRARLRRKPAARAK
jgi:hypothetical protein